MTGSLGHERKIGARCRQSKIGHTFVSMEQDRGHPPDRKYGDEEVEQIFERATSDDSEGLTLGQLQEVGEEVGLHPERVAAAAAEIDARPQPVSWRVWNGEPLSVSRVVDLPRGATDGEWQILVTELRETFGVRGRVASHGEIREWSEGHLHAFLEPTRSGYRLRLGATKGMSPEVNAIGGLGLVLGLVLLATRALDAATFGVVLESLIPATLVAISGWSLTANYRRLRHWADKRERQMEHIAGRARTLVSGPPPAE